MIKNKDKIGGNMEDITKPRKKQAVRESIVVGKRYKYKELCQLFGENECHGNQRTAQMNSWCLRYDIIHEQGSQYYLINEIYERALKKEELRGRKTSTPRISGRSCFCCAITRMTRAMIYITSSLRTDLSCTFFSDCARIRFWRSRITRTRS